MKFSTLLSFTASAISTVFAQGETFQVPVPWAISDISVSNVRHGTGGTWQFNIVDTPTPTPQGFNTTCLFTSASYDFALDDAPYDAPCADPSVTFGFFASSSSLFTFNVTHTYAGNCSGSACSTSSCVDNGTWYFSWDDVRGQEDDVQNNFGQAGYFSRSGISMYPTRAIASTKCEFC